jgi:hypothetical protein
VKHKKGKTMTNSDINMPIAKASSAIAAATAAKTQAVEQLASSAGATTSSDPVIAALLALPWATIAQVAAAMYSLLLISEWFWKKLWRPFAERRGWLKPKRMRILTVEEYEAGNTGPAAL